MRRHQVRPDIVEVLAERMADTHQTRLARMPCLTAPILVLTTTPMGQSHSCMVGRLSQARMARIRGKARLRLELVGTERS